MSEDSTRNPIRRALVSVYDKTGLVELGRALAAAGVEIVSTGSTAARLSEAGIEVTPVEELTGFPECLDGRVKTLHPMVHAGILADRRLASHRDQLARLGVKPFDLVVSNLYPFTRTVASGADFDACIEQIDIGGPSMVRAAAKNEFRKREGVGLTYLAFITKAATEALRDFPKVNASVDQEAGTITYHDSEDIGIAVDTPKGLMVPVIKDAGDLNVGGIAKRIGDLAARARDGRIGPDELNGATFTITNYGSTGTLFDTPIVNQPNVAILGTGAMVKRPIVVTDAFGDDTVAIRPMMYLSLTYDHRLVDGADASRFLSALKARLEEGDFGGEFGQTQ